MNEDDERRFAGEIFLSPKFNLAMIGPVSGMKLIENRVGKYCLFALAVGRKKGNRLLIAGEKFEL